MARGSGVSDQISGVGLKIGLIVARFNEEITSQLLQGALQTLSEKGVLPSDMEVCWVPGAFEIPLMSQALAKTGKYDALIALGCVIRGDTPHFDYVAGTCARGVMQVSLENRLPVVFGVLTTNNKQQAEDRTTGPLGNKGAEAALTAMEMARLIHGTQT